MTSQGWVVASDLKPGDRVHIMNRRGGFGVGGSLNEGRILGWLVGDGTVNVVRAVLSFFGDEKRELAPMFAQAVTTLVERPDQRRAYPVGVTEIEERDEARVCSERLLVWAAKHGLVEDKFQVPASVFAGSEEMQQGFAQALFTADGYVNDGGEKGCSVRLASSLSSITERRSTFVVELWDCQSHLRGTSRQWLSFNAGWTRRHEEYLHRAQHELAISKTNLKSF